MSTTESIVSLWKFSFDYLSHPFDTCPLDICKNWQDPAQSSLVQAEKCLVSQTRRVMHQALVISVALLWTLSGISLTSWTQYSRAK